MSFIVTRSVSCRPQESGGPLLLPDKNDGGCPSSDWLFENPTSFTSSSITPTSVCFATGCLLVVSGISWVSPVSMRWHTVGPSVVIAVYSKDISVLGEEFVQLLGFTSLRSGLAAAITSYNFGIVSQTRGYSTSGRASSVTGSECNRRYSLELVVATGSIQVIRGYLLAVSVQDPENGNFFGRVVLRTRFYQAIFHSEETFKSTRHQYFALCRYHLIVSHCQAGRPGPHTETP
jgi:hypothetical protein